MRINQVTQLMTSPNVIISQEVIPSTKFIPYLEVEILAPCMLIVVEKSCTLEGLSLQSIQVFKISQTYMLHKTDIVFNSFMTDLHII